MAGTNGNSSSGKEAAKAPSQISPPPINLPKGGGAIRGMGEKFAANPVTGSGSMTVPIATSPGRSGFGPQLSLSYDSGAGNGPFGFGWSLPLPSITRKTDKGLPKYQDAQDSDVFILSGAEDLVPVLVEQGGQWVRQSLPPRTVGGISYSIQRYRPRIEGLFARIERWTNKTDPQDTFWRSISKDNITTWYGKSSESRIQDPTDPARTFSWLISESHDDKGNVISYAYKEENSEGVATSQAHERNRTADTRKANRYLKHIRYGNHEPYFPKLAETTLWPTVPPNDKWYFQVVFDYGEHAPDVPTPTDSGTWPRRNDPFSSYRAGFEVRAYRLCQRVLMFHHFPGETNIGQNCLVRSTDFTYSYEQNPTDARNPIYSFLLSVTQSGYKRDGAGYMKRSLPPVEFEYTQPIVQDMIEVVDVDSLENLPMGLDGTAYQWTDLHGEGIAGILSEQGGAWFYKRNWSPIPDKLSDGSEVVKAKFSALETVTLKPNIALNGGAQFMDLAGDGQPDLVTLDGPTPGFYEHDEAEGWQSFRPFTSRLNRDTRDPNLKFVDLDGDGHADVLITEDNALVWHPSQAEAGFGPARRVAQPRDEEKGPRLVLADGTQSVYLADLSGDGLTDLVRIRNGEVCYWPNLGYGTFGAKVTMDQSPWFDNPDQFDHKRIRLADIDGSGTTDIIYLHRAGVRLYFNQSGNSWSQPRILNVFPRVEDLAAIVPTDLLGNGTACLVWSSPLPGDARRPMRYVNLMGDHKPHLLVKTVNNLGAETRVQYAPSNKFYLQDKRDGKPWITKLPFPAHVVERVETYDHISRNRFVTRYTYHHGYFDGEEREFRGFGRVDQLDTEEFAALTLSGNFPVGENIDAASHVPPVLTKTWFHTGVYLGRNHVSDYFAGLLDTKDVGEYYREPGLTDVQAQALLLDDTVLPSGLTIEEEREACRALKGAMLRQEVYAQDSTDKQSHPYTVTEQNFTIRSVQPRGENRHTVWFTHPGEVLSYHYEQNPTDPRISHTLTLEVDTFGNVLKAAVIGYGRRQPDPSLSPTDQAKQTQPLMTYTENTVTNAIDDAAHLDDYRTPLPAESRTYELTGLPAPAAGDRYALDEMLLAETGAAPIPYEQSLTSGMQEKRLIEQMRTLYRKNDLTGFLALGQLESLALPGESYQLAFTPGLLTQVYGARVTTAMLAEEGTYVHSEGDDNWWMPSGRLFFSPGTNNTPAQELAQASLHFFLPRRYRDPFHTTAAPTETIVTYDPHDLLVRSTEDAVGNTVSAEHDYRVLAPHTMTDPNGNQTAAVFDTLGLVVGTAVMGKPSPAPVEGDSLSGFVADLTPEQVDGFFNAGDPQVPAPGLLNAATTRIIYDLDRFWVTQQINPTDPTQWLPPSAATLARETHASDPLPATGLKIQVTVSYSDGFGREIQKKIQAEPGPVPQRGANGKIVIGADGQPVMTVNDVSPRWVGSGWTVFNNKGKPVRQYEPFFTDTHRFEFDVKIGVSPVLFYDPVERVVTTLHPNHTYEKVRFDPWRQETWDVNDTVLVADPKADPDVGDFFRRLPDAEYLPTWHEARKNGQKGPEEKAAAEKTAIHANTPTMAHFDTLGRPFLTLAHNGFNPDTTPIQFATRVELDIEGNQREVIDAKDRVVMRYAYDMLGNRVHQLSMEAGARWMLNNVTGKPIRAWDSRAFVRRMTYDELRRPTGLFVTENGAERLAERTVYGEGQGDATNHRTRVFQVFDAAGIVTSEQYDFKGNLLRSSRELLADYKSALDWQQNPVASDGVFTSSTTYDALNRPLTATAPDSSIYRPTFNEANLLNQVDVNLRGAMTATPFVTNIDYSAKGQRERIDYGNGVHTTYTYDPDTFRLTRLQTLRGGEPLQDLRYTYDPAGNITSIRDEAQQTIYFNNAVVAPHADYTYDAIYRLIEATGREHIGQAAKPQTTWNDEGRVKLVHPHDGQAMRRYAERYQYDEVGNFEQLIHTATNGNWTRSYTYQETSQIEPTKVSNRLSGTQVGTTSETYSYDAHGSMLNVPHLATMIWDFEDQLQQVDLGGGGTAYYVYDAAGQRIRKVLEKNNGTLIEERLYLGGFEIFRSRQNGTVMLERETLHIMDDKQRIALAETKTLDIASPLTPHPSLVRYQFGNHLGSASLELDDAGQMISYEEYHPYGTTSYQAVRSGVEVSPKRYRYTSKERDEESGLYYHGARYYAAWLGRWISTDPVGLRDGVNRYQYASGRPTTRIDPAGLTSIDASPSRHATVLQDRIIFEDLVKPRSGNETMKGKRGQKGVKGQRGTIHVPGFGSVAPHSQQGPAHRVPGSANKYLSESEHIWPQSHAELVHGSPELRSAYNKATTLKIPEAVADLKTKWDMEVLNKAKAELQATRKLSPETLKELSHEAGLDRLMRARDQLKMGKAFSREQAAAALDRQVKAVESAVAKLRAAAPKVRVETPKVGAEKTVQAEAHSKSARAAVGSKSGQRGATEVGAIFAIAYFGVILLDDLRKAKISEERKQIATEHIVGFAGWTASLEVIAATLGRAAAGSIGAGLMTCGDDPWSCSPDEQSESNAPQLIDIPPSPPPTSVMQAPGTW